MKRLLLTLAVTLWLPTVAHGQPVLGTNPAIPSNLQITTFATGLSLPYGLYRLPDGSILTATSNGLTSAIRRFTQTGGIADAPTTVFTGGLGRRQSDHNLPGWRRWCAHEHRPDELRFSGELLVA